MLYFDPQRMLSDAELSRVKLMCAQRDELLRGSDGDSPTQAHSKLEQRDALSAHVDALLAEVWKREANLERYSAISAFYQGEERRNVIERFDIRFYPEDTFIAWLFFGLRLTRKGVIGPSRNVMPVKEGTIYRRMLDGTWTQVIVRGAP